MSIRDRYHAARFALQTFKTVVLVVQRYAQHVAARAQPVRLALRLGVSYEKSGNAPPDRKRHNRSQPRQKSAEQRFQETERYCFRAVSYTHLDVYKRQELILSVWTIRRQKKQSLIEQMRAME